MTPGKTAINAIHELVRDAGKPLWLETGEWTLPAKDEALIAKIGGLAQTKMEAAYQSAQQAGPHPGPAPGDV